MGVRCDSEGLRDVATVGDCRKKPLSCPIQTEIPYESQGTESSDLGQFPHSHLKILALFLLGQSRYYSLGHLV